MKRMYLIVKRLTFGQYFAFFYPRNAAIDIIYVYLASLNKALQFPFWVIVSHDRSQWAKQQMKLQ